MAPAWFDRLKHHPNPWIRRIGGVLLVVGGVLGFLPVLGFWMIPLGLILLSDDIPWLRHRRRGVQVSLIRMWERRRGRLRRWFPEKTRGH